MLLFWSAGSQAAQTQRLRVVRMSGTGLVWGCKGCRFWGVVSSVSEFGLLRFIYCWAWGFWRQDAGVWVEGVE